MKTPPQCSASIRKHVGWKNQTTRTGTGSQLGHAQHLDTIALTPSLSTCMYDWFTWLTMLSRNVSFHSPWHTNVLKSRLLHEGKLQSQSVGNLGKAKQILKINDFKPKVDAGDNLFQVGFLSFLARVPIIFPMFLGCSHSSLLSCILKVYQIRKMKLIELKWPLVTQPGSRKAWRTSLLNWGPHWILDWESYCPSYMKIFWVL